MNKKILLLTVLFTLFAVTILSAQTVDPAYDESDYYVRTFRIVKVYPHNIGYKIIYLKSDQNMAVFYVPIDWFIKAEGKGILLWGDHDPYPYFSVFWKNGEFSHLKLYLKRDKTDRTWGSLDDSINIYDKFQAVLDSGKLELDF